MRVGWCRWAQCGWPCRQARAKAVEASRLGAQGWRGTHFTCFTSTKVQIRIQEGAAGELCGFRAHVRRHFTCSTSTTVALRRGSVEAFDTRAVQGLHVKSFYRAPLTAMQLGAQLGIFVFALHWSTALARRSVPMARAGTGGEVSPLVPALAIGGR
jgi:hypothetical protein